MTNYYARILADFVKGVSSVTVVADPDSILSDEKVLLGLNERGFEVETYLDSMEFRYVYESKYRSHARQNPEIDLILIVNGETSEVQKLPYDVLKCSRTVAINLGDLFPNLSYPILKALPRSILADLYEAHLQHGDARLGDVSSSDFVLRHVYYIAHEMIRDDVALLRELLRLHYKNLRLPEPLARRLASALSVKPNFKQWPIYDILHSEAAFYEFLQERWQVFVNQLDKDLVVYEGSLSYAGPRLLPFEHQDIRVYIDNLFVEGKLKPVRKPAGLPIPKDSLIRCGILENPEADLEVRIERLFRLVDTKRPGKECRHQDWINFALDWAELLSLVYQSKNLAYHQKAKQLSKIYNEDFTGWLQAHISSLASLPPQQPVMVHHIARFLARHREEQRSQKVALLVIDGLSLDQWISMKSAISKASPRLQFEESAAFAWVPTITAVSRQAIFAGRPPYIFPSTISHNEKEHVFWQQFWEDAGIAKNEVIYIRGLRDHDSLAELTAQLHPTTTNVVGVIVDKVDKITHGMQNGAAGMHNQIVQWCEQGVLVDLIQQLHQQSFAVWITADHGNVECEGSGRLSEGAKSVSRGERVRVFSSPELRAQVASTSPGTIEWEPAGLPSNYFPLLAGNGAAFKNKGETLISHGGASIEEVMVPFVKVVFSE